MYVLATTNVPETGYLVSNRYDCSDATIHKEYNPYDPMCEGYELIRFSSKEVAAATAAALVADALKRGYPTTAQKLAKLSPVEEPVFKKEPWW